VTWFPGSGEGVSGTNYDVTQYGYDPNGRAEWIKTPDGTITWNVLDARGLVLSTWVGTDATGATHTDPSANGTNEMVKVSANIYDYGNDGGDGLLTESRTYYNSENYYATKYYYDERNRLTDVRTAAGVVTHYEYDNLGRTLWTKTYADVDADYFTYSGSIITDVNVESGELRAQTRTYYDDLGRVYETWTYEVDQATDASPGTYRDYLPSRTWYNARGRVVKTADANGLFTKYDYDPTGRLVTTYTSFDADETAYADADDVAGDMVVEQAQYYYDTAGQMVATATFERLPGDTTTEGTLSAANSYATAAVVWHDGLGRTIASATYGREDKNSGLDHYVFHATSGTDAGGAYAAGDLIDVDRDGIPDVAEAAPPAYYGSNGDSSGDAYIVSFTQYNSAGRAYRTTDNLGRIDETQYDAAGRVTRTIENWVNGTVEETDTDCDGTVAYEYSAGRLVTLTAYNAKGDGNGVEQQKTIYLYESTINASWQTNVIYPDSEDARSVTSLVQSSGTATATVVGHGFSSGDWVYVLGADQAEYNGYVKITVTSADTFTYAVAQSATSPATGTIRVYGHTGTDQVKTAYDRLGRTATTTDQRGVVHTYTFDTAGRLSADTATNLGSSNIVDDSVLRIGTTYDDLGRVQTVTSYSDTSGNSPVNQVKYVYNSWGQVAREYQAHDVTGSLWPSPSVQYTYDAPRVSGEGQSEPVKYVRLSQVTYPNGREVNYDYSGAIDNVMSRLSAIFDDANDDGDIDTGEDVYASYKYLGAGSVVEENYEQADVKLSYLDASDNVTGLDRFDRVVDQVWEDYSGTPTPIDEYTYTYDRAGNRTGRANETKTDGSLDETYTYDALDRLASWSLDGSLQKSWAEMDGLGNDLATGEYNAANEMTPDVGSSGYDAAGNMTTLRSGDTAVYDAWNRLVEVNDGETIVESYEYDGAGRRIQVSSDFDGSTPDKVVDDYHKGQQTIESDVTVDAQRAGGYQMIWSPRYIDSLILRDTLNTAGTDIVTADRVFYLADANYNVTGLVKYISGEWQVAERNTYTPYGEVQYRNTNWTTAGFSANANTTLYTGRTLDLATGLYYYRARYYDAALERFVSRDPIIYEGGGSNLYQYVLSNPLRYVDPQGLYNDGSQANQALCARLINRYSIVVELVAHPDRLEWEEYQRLEHELDSLLAQLAASCTDLGHGNMPGGDRFDWTLEDHDPNTDPLHHCEYHFQDLATSENQVRNAIQECNYRDFVGSMHRGQDFWAHYAQGYRAPLGHGANYACREVCTSIGISPPDDPDRPNRPDPGGRPWVPYLDAWHWTEQMVALWDQNCSHVPLPPVVRRSGPTAESVTRLPNNIPQRIQNH